MSMNERSVVADNLRVLFSRYRNKAEVWGNFKAVSQAQLKFDIMNISEKNPFSLSFVLLYHALKKKHNKCIILLRYRFFCFVGV